MRVFRVEHLYCARSSCHGPMTGPICENPRYGGNGPCPQYDYPLHYIRAWESCGTLRHQFDDWWEFNSDRKLPQGWVISEYEVPDCDVRIGEHQVVFPKASAKRINAYHSVQSLPPVPNTPPPVLAYTIDNCPRCMDTRVNNYCDSCAQRDQYFNSVAFA